MTRLALCPPASSYEAVTDPAQQLAAGLAAQVAAQVALYVHFKWPCLSRLTCVHPH